MSDLCYRFVAPLLQRFSNKARRLKRIKPGFYNPPGGRPIFVPGFNLLQVVVTGLRGAPILAHLRFWTTRGETTTTKRQEEHRLLQQVAQCWRRMVIHNWPLIALA